MRQAANYALRALDTADREFLVSLISKNPELFQKIAGELTAAKGEDQETAVTRILSNNRLEIEAALGPDKDRLMAIAEKLGKGSSLLKL